MTDDGVCEVRAGPSRAPSMLSQRRQPRAPPQIRLQFNGKVFNFFVTGKKIYINDLYTWGNVTVVVSGVVVTTSL